MPNAGSIVGIILVVLFVGCLALLLFQGPTLRTPRARRAAILKARRELEALYVAYNRPLAIVPDCLPLYVKW